MSSFRAGLATGLVLVLAFSVAAMADFEQGFETDTVGWDLFGGSFDAVRVPSGNGGITSATGDWHALVGIDVGGARTAGNGGG